MRIAEFIAVGVLLCLIGCGGGGSDSTSAAPSRFLYASGVGGPNANPAAIYGFAVYPGGAISSIASSGTATDFGGGPITITRDSKLLYTTYADTVKASEIHPDGSLTNSVSPSFQMPPGTRVSGLVADPAADFLYASSYSTTLSPGVLTVFAIDSATGALSQTSSVTLGNEFIENSAAITPNGRYLYQNDVYPGEGSIPTTLQIAGFSTSTTTGALNPVPGSPLSPTTPATSSIHQMAIEPTGKFLYASYQPFVTKVGDEGGIAAYSIDTASGGLTAVPGSPFDVGLSPYSLAVDASGRFLIVSI